MEGVERVVGNVSDAVDSCSGLVSGGWRFLVVVVVVVVAPGANMACARCFSFFFSNFRFVTQCVCNRLTSFP